MSEPRVTIASLAATAAADPPDEPPGILSVSNGFFVGLKCEFSVDEPIANSSMLSLPVTTISSSLFITVALKGGT